MDKYEYNLKLEEIDKLVDQGDYEEAAALADTIDWRRVRNVRTLCLISEIYEAADRLDKSKDMLVRAYRKSPVGRTVLYRLVEVTTALGQYDEALEYYSEYVQVAPHDNNRYILKYMIYKGRGSSPEELISILEEYLGQEYTEKWAYELALNYQQAGQMQKCLATCDDLVLWFHSGKYVKKALELKKKYAALTPRQQDIFEACLQEEEQEEYDSDMHEMSGLAGTDETDGDVIAENIIAETEKEIAGAVSAMDTAEEPADELLSAITLEPETASESAEEPADAKGYAGEPEAERDDLQVELAKSVRKVISGVAHKSELNEDDVPAAVEERLRNIQETPVRREPEPEAEQMSIDDVLLAMGNSSDEATDEAEPGAAGVPGSAKEEPGAAGAAETADEEPKTADEEPKTAEEKPKTAEEEPTADDEEKQKKEDEHPEEEKGEPLQTEEAQEKAGTKTRPRSAAEAMAEDLTEEQLEALKYSANPGKFLKNRSSLPVYSSKEGKEDPEQSGASGDAEKDHRETAFREQMEAKTIRIPTEEVAHAFGQAAGTFEKDTEAGRKENAAPASETGTDEERPEEADEEYFDGMLTIEPHLRGLFPGFTEVDGLEDQIANAILQAMSKGDDRTSRSGNILIFGAHGAGKTTLATEIAKAIALEKGEKVAKMARIYASDLNRKDIAATIAKIAGGTLIIEEAGDLEDKTVEQLTTAMEFRTDGLIVILEDEQRYVHELLMNHPRFTMKFTAQIYLPDYTLEELLVFAELHANEQDCKISDEAAEAIARKVDAAAQTDTPITIAGIIEMVDKAIRSSNKLSRKMTMGKKRYDEDNYILLFEKDFK